MNKIVITLIMLFSFNIYAQNKVKNFDLPAPLPEIQMISVEAPYPADYFNCNECRSNSIDVIRDAYTKFQSLRNQLIEKRNKLVPEAKKSGDLREISKIESDIFRMRANINLLEIKALYLEVADLKSKNRALEDKCIGTDVVNDLHRDTKPIKDIAPAPAPASSFNESTERR